VHVPHALECCSAMISMTRSASGVERAPNACAGVSVAVCKICDRTSSENLPSFPRGILHAHTHNIKEKTSALDSSQKRTQGAALTPRAPTSSGRGRARGTSSPPWQSPAA
jgi:hypothetical protein